MRVDSATGITIDPSRDELLTPFAHKLLKEHYLRDGEEIQEGFARAAKAWSAGDDALAQRLYNGASKRWFMFASPVLSNAPLPGEKMKGMPISCFLTYVGDNLEELIEHSTEVRWLSVLGGGVGGHWSDVRSVSKKAPGPIPFMHTINADMDAYAQGTTRRGSYAAYLDVSHPDIVEHISLRILGGDDSRKCMSKGFHHGVNITDDFMRAVERGDEWKLIDPHDKQVREVVSARMLWETILDARMRAGEPYLFFIDAARRAFPEAQRRFGIDIKGSNLCTEITLATGRDIFDKIRTAVCCLSSLNAETYDEWRGSTIVADLTRALDNVLQEFIENAPPQLSRAVYSAMRERSLGVGLMGFHAYLQRHMVAFESEEARKINKALFAYIKSEAVKESERLAIERGEAPDMEGTGRRNAHLIAPAPNANNSIILATSAATEVAPANIYTHDVRIGVWEVKNRYLEDLLEAKGRNTVETWDSIKLNKGSVQHLDFLDEHEKKVFRTATEVSSNWVIRHAADRQPFICQAQSINLFFEAGMDKEKLSDIHMLAWRLGLKSLYYCRTTSSNRAENVNREITREALQDSRDNTEEECIACQG